MKKTLLLFITFLLTIMLVACGNNKVPTHPSQTIPTESEPAPSETKEPTPLPTVKPSPTPEPSPTEVPELMKHLILDSEGNYGGTTNKSKYGIGAPFNGTNDIIDSEYYMVTDYYNMQSTRNRTINTNFKPYQQTMADSSGIASALMVLNHFGEDVYDRYNEVNLVNQYEDLNNSVIFGNGTTPNGLKNLFEDIGYTASTNEYTPIGSNRTDRIDNFAVWMKDQLDRGRLVLVRWHSGMSFNWNVVIGIDSMGTSAGRDDALILADPYDNLDHFQDGYHVTPAGRFHEWWMDVQLSGEYTNQYDHVVIEPKTPRRFERVAESTEIIQEIPDIYLLRNPDGTYGGTRDAAKWGSIRGGNGITDHLHSVYYKFNDYYNMLNNNSRIILPEYRMFQQTMASSCGICSTLSVLNYYGIDVETYDEVYLVEKYQELTGNIIYNVGVGANGLKSTVATFGYIGIASSYSKANYVNENSMTFSTYQSFLDWALGYLEMGVPIPVSWRPHGGHWEVIIGIDTMGTDNPYDDVIILADSSDSWDHYQDGYNTLPATRFYRQWYNGSFTYNQQFMVFENNSIYD